MSHVQAKVFIGAPARAVAFSPNGAHLAVGCVSGMVKVLMLERLADKVAEMRDSRQEVAVRCAMRAAWLPAEPGVRCRLCAHACVCVHHT